MSLYFILFFQKILNISENFRSTVTIALETCFIIFNLILTLNRFYNLCRNKRVKMTRILLFFMDKVLKFFIGYL